MLVKVVDASALGALVFGEPQAEEVAAELTDSMLVAPALLAFELASICLKKIRHHPNSRDDLLAAHDLASRMAIKMVTVEHREVISLAERNGLTTYDAAYLWLANTLGASLVTLDLELARAANLSS